MFISFGRFSFQSGNLKPSLAFSELAVFQSRSVPVRCLMDYFTLRSEIIYCIEIAFGNEAMRTTTEAHEHVKVSIFIW